jgi:hypothetical protein
MDNHPTKIADQPGAMVEYIEDPENGTIKITQRAKKALAEAFFRAAIDINKIRTAKQFRDAKRQAFPHMVAILQDRHPETRKVFDEILDLLYE